MSNKSTVTIVPSEFVLNLDKKPVKLDEEDLRLGRAFALVLVSGNGAADPLRAYTLARKISDATDPVELDASEVSFLREAMEKFTGFTTLVMGQLYEHLA